MIIAPIIICREYLYLVIFFTLIHLQKIAASSIMIIKARKTSRIPAKMHFGSTEIATKIPPIPQETAPRRAFIRISIFCFFKTDQ